MLVYSRLIEVRVQRRVVITGMGAVSPNGVGNPSFSQAVLDGRSGVRCISRFDASEISVQIAGEVADFDELAWVDRRERKHVSRERSEEHTSELQSPDHLVCRLLLEKK